MVILMMYTNPDITHDDNNTHCHNGNINSQTLDNQPLVYQPKKTI